MAVSENTSCESATRESGTADWFGPELARAQIPLFAYARALMAGSVDAWDVLQDANRIMCQKSGELKSAADFLPWAHTVVRYEVLTYRKRASRDRHHFNAELLDELADRAVAHSSGFAERLAALEHCLGKLPDRQQECIALRYTEALSVGEIARRLERAENAIAAVLYRARLALAHCIESKLAVGEKP